MRTIVLPGDKIADRKLRVENTYNEGEATYAAVIGMLDETGRFIPLEAVYKPLPDDVAVGVIIDSRHAGYEVQLNMPFTGFIPKREIRISFNVGEVIMGRVRDVNEVGEVDLTEIRKLPKGHVVSFPPAKIPRLIGKKNSMINMIKEQTKSDIVVGNNGFVWIGENADIAKVMSAINLIIKKAHMSGLTDEVAKFLAPQGE
jgi:exosome complex component RRP4